MFVWVWMFFIKEFWIFGCLELLDLGILGFWDFWLFGLLEFWVLGFVVFLLFRCLDLWNYEAKHRRWQNMNTICVLVDYGLLSSSPEGVISTP